MKVQELTKKIHDDYPKCYVIMRQWICDYILRNAKFINLLKTNIEEIPFSMFYGLLEDFFEKNGLNIIYEPINNEWKIWFFTIGSYKNAVWFESGDYNSKNEAKEQAILKACEILEEKL